MTSRRTHKFAICRNWLSPTSGLKRRYRKWWTRAQTPSDVFFRRVASGNVFEETVEQLMQAIKLGMIRQGDCLPPERELAPRLGVSRVTLREAIRALDQAGLLESKRGRNGGTFVIHRPRYAASEQTARRLAREMGDRLLDALDFRLVVEPAAAELAAERAGATGHQRLRELLDETLRARPADYRISDSRLHIAIAELAGSPSLSRAVADVQVLLTDVLAAIPRLEQAIDHSHKQHSAIIAAIVAKNGPRARAAMEEHVTATSSLLRGFLA